MQYIPADIPSRASRRILWPASLLALVAILCAAPSAWAEWSVIRQDLSGVTAVWTTSRVTADTIRAYTAGERSEIDVLQIEIDDAAPVGDEGSPALPKAGINVAVPPGMRAQATASANNYTTLNGILGPNPEARLGESELGFSKHYAMNPAAYAVPSDPPLVMSEVITHVRGVDVLHLTVAPVSYDPALNEILVAQTVTVRVNFVGSPPVGGPRTVLLPSFWKGSLLNYDNARTWTLPDEPRKRLAQPERSEIASGSWLRIMVTNDGMYRLTAAQVIAAYNRFRDAPIERLAMMIGTGEELPTSPASIPAHEWTILRPLVSDVNGDGLFNGNDEILFYGTAPSGWKQQRGGEWRTRYVQNRYTPENVYWLGILDSGEGAKAHTIDGAPAHDGLPVIDRFQKRRREQQETRNFNEQYDTVESVDGAVGGINWEWQRIEVDENITVSITLTDVVDEEVWFSVGELRWDDGCDLLRVYFGPSPEMRVSATRDGHRVHQRFRTTVEPASSVVLPVRLQNVNQFRLCDATMKRKASFLSYYEIEYWSALKVPAGANSFHFTILPTRVVGAQDTVIARISGLDRSIHRLFDITRGGLTEVRIPAQGADGVTEVQLPRDGMIEREYLVVKDQAWLSPARFLPAMPRADLRARTAGVDYIVVTHPEFYNDARRLAEMRETHDNFRTFVASTRDVFDQYSYGLYDPAAIRNFLKDAASNWRDGLNDEGLQYVVLVGDGHYNYRNINRPRSSAADPHYDNWMPTYQDGSLVTDDWFTVFSSGYVPTVPIGRLPVRSSAQARIAVDKIIAYEEQPERGAWQNRVIMACDDEYNPDTGSSSERFLADCEDLLTFVRPETISEKVYQTEYPFNPQRNKPGASEALINAWNDGALVLYYVGHGSSRRWSHERLFTVDTQLSLLRNRTRLPVVVAITCSAGHFDHPETESAAEELIVAPNGGAVATVAATRLVYNRPNVLLGSAFLQNLYSDNSRVTRVGDAFFAAKASMIGTYTANTRKFTLMGDPALALAAPELPVIVSLNRDTLEALSPVRISGEVLTPDSITLTSFDGKALVQLFDSNTRAQHRLGGGPMVVNYERSGLPLYRGIADVSAGRYEIFGILPREVVYGGTDARAIVQVWNEQIDGAGGIRRLPISETAGTGIGETDGPEIVFTEAGESDDISFVDPIMDGAVIPRGEPLRIWLSDPSGINVTGSIGHRLTVTIDNDPEPIDITNDFVHRGSATTGFADVHLRDDLAVQRVAVQAWNNLNNVSRDSIVVRLGEREGIRMRNVIAHPNPMTDNQTTFTWITEGLANDLADATVRIFTVAGRLVDEVTITDIADGPALVPWEPVRTLANGVYLYQITVRRRTDGKTARAIERLAVLGS